MSGRSVWSRGPERVIVVSPRRGIKFTVIDSPMKLLRENGD